MSLPSTGQISFSDVATEMSMSQFTANQYNYWFGYWANGTSEYPYGEGFIFTPINVHGDNSGKYSTTTPLSLNTWHGYNRNANYAADDTFRSLFFALSPTGFCYSSAMLQFDAGTSNNTYDITISGSVNDFSYTSAIVVWYGKPWYSAGVGGHGGATKIYDYTGSFASGLNTTISNYSYTYDSNKGQYIYVVIYGTCP